MELVSPKTFIDKNIEGKLDRSLLWPEKQDPMTGDFDIMVCVAGETFDDLKLL